MITLAVITCNRLHYLKNCVKSILRFVDLSGMKLLIIDNATSEPGIEEYLSSLPDSVEIKRYRKRNTHELHRAMNFAIEYSRANGSKYVNFIQDDYQYLFCYPDLRQIVTTAFESFPDIIQVQTNMGWKKKAKKIGKTTTALASDGTKWHFLHQKPACDNGFTRIAFYDKFGLYPKNTSVHGREVGYSSGEFWIKQKAGSNKRIMLAKPNMGMLMDCAYIRGNKRIGRYFAPPSEFYLSPLSDDDLKRMEELAQKNKMCFLEDFVKPDGWKPETSEKHSPRKKFVYV